MNKLLTDYNRGFSLKSNDLRWVDDSVRLAIADLCKGLGISGPVILWGCNATYSGTTATVTEGAIFFQEEVWHVSAHTFTVTDPVGSPVWAFVLTYHPDGAKLDKDLAPHQTYQIRRAVGAQVGIPFPAETIPFAEVPRVDNNYSTVVLPIESGITGIGGESTVIKSGRLAMIEVGVAVNVSAAMSTLIATIPEGFRPFRTIRGVCLMSASTATSKSMAGWRITSDGYVYIDKLDDDQTGTWNIYFSSELYRIV
ncbi:MAG: hypothetical protein FD170_1423 [Bacteroidetes bacterium]|nr:MAG: hypothetical protein FD170_1423 [Bacteroidota bacterium]